MADGDPRAIGQMRRSDRVPAGERSGDDAHHVREDVSPDGRGALRHGESRLEGVFPTVGGAHASAGIVSGRGQRASGAGRSHGGSVGEGLGRSDPRGLRFDVDVAPGGYTWWYLDALSDDGSEGLTVIAFIGSVFSPYYAFAGRRDPRNHCALNVALYRNRHSRWAMTERGRDAIETASHRFEIGPSAL
ncbi:MAG: carotenoid 1,2-hydratase, partial [Pseudomonadota bacterium]